MKKNKIAILVIGIILLVAIIGIAFGIYKVYQQKSQGERSYALKTIETFSPNQEITEKLIKIENEKELLEAENTIIVLENEKPGEEPEDQPIEKESQSEEGNTGTTPYYIKVNYGAQVVTIYKKDEAGYYTVPYKAMVCSTGIATPTSGVYALPASYKKAVKARWIYLQGDVWGQYGTRITGNILFHSVPYEKEDPSTLEWWEYDKLGVKASLGCIRLTVKDAKWIYENCSAGTKVEFYSSSNPGPLGKPTAQKISNADASVRIWDPTDPSADNPWKTYKEEQEEEKQPEKQPQGNTIENTTNSQPDKESGLEENVVNNTEKPTNQVSSNTIKNETMDNSNTITNQNNTNNQTNTTKAIEKEKSKV